MVLKVADKSPGSCPADLTHPVINVRFPHTSYKSNDVVFEYILWTLAALLGNQDGHGDKLYGRKGSEGLALGVVLTIKHRSIVLSEAPHHLKHEAEVRLGF